MNREEYAFAYNINGTGMSGIITMTNPPKLVCYCDEENSKTILKALNTPLPPAEGAEEILESIVESLGEPTNIHNHIFEIRPYTVEHKTEWWIFHKEVGSGEPLAQWLQNFATLHTLPPAEGAEEIDDETIAWAAEHQCGTPFSERWIGFVKGAKWHRSLHAQRIAERMVGERLREELIAYDRWMSSQKWGVRELLSPETTVNEYLKSREDK